MRDVTIVILWTALVGTLCVGAGYLDGKRAADRWYASHPEDCKTVLRLFAPGEPGQCAVWDGQKAAWGTCQ